MQQGSSDRAAPVSQRLQWDDVRYFLALARLGSLSAASRSLDVEHSTVARRVEALERALGLRLFDRLPRGWTLTTEGEALVVQAKGLEDQAIAFSRAALGVASLAGTVRISAPPMTASHFLAPRLATLREAWPDIDLELIGESRDADLAHGEVDLALRLARPTAAGLAARALGGMGSGLYASPAHAVRPPQEWVFLGYDRSLGQVAQHTWLEGIADGRRFVLRSNDLAVLYQACRAGLGIALLPISWPGRMPRWSPCLATMRRRRARCGWWCTPMCAARRGCGRSPTASRRSSRQRRPCSIRRVRVREWARTPGRPGPSVSWALPGSGQ